MTTPFSVLEDPNCPNTQACTSSQAILNPAFLPQEALYGDGGDSSVGWQLSKSPFGLSQERLNDIHRFGAVLYQWMKAIDFLYKESVKGKMPGWIATLLDQGKPEALIRYSRMNRFKNTLPSVLRPDLLLTESGWALCEIDSVPGGIGFTSALNQAYKQSGFPVIESPDTMPISFLKMLQGLIPEKDRPENRPPNIAIILSDEAMDYHREMQWLTQSIQSHYPDFYLIHPNQVELVRDQLVFKDTDGEEKPIDLIYRFFELFDLVNIPKIELIQYAIKKGFVACTPPFKPHTEEKLTLALLHHPSLMSFWKSQLGESDFQWLKASVPAGWILDPSPLPPQGVIPGLSKQGQAVQSFQELMELTQKERELIIKPSGFSPLAWGGRGVTVGHDIPLTTWQESLQHALQEFSTTPYILQEYRKPSISTIQRVSNNQSTSETNESPKDLKVRTRLCPYFFIEGDTPVLAGILATSCPQDKKVIHGMKDAVISPCWVEKQT